MTAAVIEYASVLEGPVVRGDGGPPLSPYQCEVIDLQTGKMLTEVIEASAVYPCGWVRRYATDHLGRVRLNDAGDAWVQEVIYGRFEIRERAA